MKNSFSDFSPSLQAWAAIAALLVIFPAQLRAQIANWDGGGSDSNWTTGDNWDTPAVAGDTLVFLGTNDTSTFNDFGDNTDFAGIQFTNTSAGENFTLDGNTFDLTGNIVSTAATGVIEDVISAGLRLQGTGGRTISLGLNHNLTLTNGVDKSGRALTFSGAGNLSLNGGLDGAGNFTKSGTGTLTLNAAGSHSGFTNLNEGTTVLNHSSAFGTSALVNMNSGTAGSTVELGSGGLNIANNFFIRNGGNNNPRTLRLDVSGVNSGEFSGQFINNETTTGDFVVEVGADDTLTLSGDIIVTAASGISSGIAKNGSGTLRLTNNLNNYSDVTAVNAGILEISTDKALGVGGAGNGTTVTSGATLSIAGGIDYTADEEVSIAGVGTSNQGAFQNASGDNSFAGKISLTATAEVESTLGTLTLTGGIDRVGTAVLNFDGAGNIVVSTGPISGAGTVNKLGSGTLTLSSGNSYSGVTDMQGGTTIIGDSSAFGTSSLLNIRNDGTLELGANGLTVTNEFFIRNDAGGVKTIRLDLAGSNTGELSGNSTINDITPGEFVVDVGTEDTLVFSGNHTSFGAGGGAGITKTGEGTFTLSGTNDYLGATNVEAGTLLVDGSIEAGTGVNVSAGATLGGSGGTITIATTVSGGSSSSPTGGILSPGESGVSNGIGTLTLGGNLSATAPTGIGSNATWLLDLSNALNGSTDSVILGDISSRSIQLTNFDLVINDFGSFDPFSGFTYDIATYTNTGGALSSSFSGLSEGSLLTGSGGGLFQITYGHSFGGDDYSIRLTAVPEPTTLLLLLTFLLFGFWIVKRRRRFKPAEQK
ncbi:MAG: autotransporter-associated beta strand repeat-containing protein [Verrucomicrobiota bacterium]